MRDEFVRVVLFPEDVDDLVEIAADHAAGISPNTGECDGVHVANAEVRVHDVHAERRLVEERLILLAAIAQGPLGLAPHAATAGAVTRRTRAVRGR